MAISTFATTEKIINVEEYIDYIDHEIDVNDDESVVSSAGMLQALSNNKECLIKIFNSDLLQYGEVAGASYSQSSSILGISRKKGFIVRANLWPPVGSKSVKTIEKVLFSYDLAHDHNFNFLTANYFGPGYETEIWECSEPNLVNGIEGEVVPLKFLERTKLTPGKQIYFRCKKDIHIQYPPEEYTVSLNLLLVKKTDLLIDQFEFDMNSSKITSFPKGALSSRRVFLMEVAAKIGDESTVNVLLELAEKHPCQRTRATALESAIKINKEVLHSISLKVKNDSSTYVKNVLSQY